MTKLFTLIFLCVSGTLLATPPSVPDYGKLLILENREIKPHIEWGVEGGASLDNPIENVYSINALINYVTSPLWSFGLEATFNKTDEKDELTRLQANGNVRITNYTPDFFSQVTARLHLIKGQLNLLNKAQSPFEVSFVVGGGLAYNSELSKSSSLLSWGGEFLVPLSEKWKAALGIRHYKSYAFQSDELSFTSLLLGVRHEL